MLSKFNRQQLVVASAFVVAVIAAGCWYLTKYSAVSHEHDWTARGESERSRPTSSRITANCH